LSSDEARAKTDPYLHLAFKLRVSIVTDGVGVTFIIMSTDHAAATKGEKEGGEEDIANKFIRGKGRGPRANEAVASYRSSLEELEDEFFREIVGEGLKDSDAYMNKGLPISLNSMSMIAWWRRY
jgi:hypothetical protein